MSTATKQTGGKAGRAKRAKAGAAAPKLAGKANGGDSAAEVDLGRVLLKALGRPLKAADLAAARRTAKAAGAAEPDLLSLACYLVPRAAMAVGVGRRGKAGYAPRHLHLGVASAEHAALSVAAASKLTDKARLVVVGLDEESGARLRDGLSAAGLAASAVQVTAGELRAKDTKARLGRNRYVSILFDAAADAAAAAADWRAFAPRLHIGGYAVLTGEAATTVGAWTAGAGAASFEPVLQAAGVLVVKKLDESAPGVLEALSGAMTPPAQERPSAKKAEEAKMASSGELERMQQNVETLQADLSAAREARRAVEAAYDELNEKDAAKLAELGKSVRTLELDLRITRNTVRDREIEASKAKERAAVLDEQNKSLRAQIERVEARVKSAEEQVEIAAARRMDDAAALTAAREKLARVEKELAAVTAEQAELAQQREALQGEQKSLAVDLAKAEEKKSGLEQARGRLESDLAEIKQESAAQSEARRQAEEALAQAQGRVKALTEARARLESDYAELKEEAASQAAARHAAEESLAQVQERVKALNEARARLEADYAELKEEAASQGAARHAAEESLAQAQERAKGLQETLDRFDVEFKEAKAELAAQSAARREADEALTRAHYDIATLQRNYQSAAQEIEQSEQAVRDAEAARLDIEVRFADEQAIRESLERDLEAVEREGEKFREELAALSTAHAELQAVHTAGQEENERLSEALEQSRAQLEASQDEVRRLDEALEQSRAQAEAELARLMRDQEELAAAHAAEAARLREAIELAKQGVKRERQRAKEDVAAARRRGREDADLEIAALNATIRESQDLRAKEAEKRAAAEAKIDELRRAIRNRETAKSALEARLGEAEAALSAKSEALDTKSAQLEEKSARLAKETARLEAETKRLGEQRAEARRRASLAEHRAEVLTAQMHAPRILLPRLIKSVAVRTKEKLAALLPDGRGKAVAEQAAEAARIRAEVSPAGKPPAIAAPTVIIPETPEMHDAGPPQHDQTYFVNYTFGGKTRYLQRSQFLQQTLRAGRALEAMRGKFKGQRCFVIGNGPSLNHQNLYQLQDEFTIGANYIYMNHEKMGFHPTLISFSNYLVIKQRMDEIMGLTDPVKVLPFYLYDELGGGSPENTLIVNMQHQTPNFALDGSSYMSTQSTVTYVNLQLAYFLGFDKVYLIGVDNRYKQPDYGREGTVLTQEEDDPNHFTPNYFKGLKWQKGDEERIEWLYARAKIAFEARGSKIIDCTYNGALTIFDKQDLDTVIRTSPPPPAADVSRTVELMKKVTKPEPGDELTPKKVVITVSTDLHDKFGHHYNMDRYLREIARDKGHELVALCSANLDTELRDEHNWMIPTFTGRSWLSRLDESVVRRKTTAFKDDLIKALAVVEAAFEPGTEFTLYMYTGNLPLAKAMAEVVQGRPNMEAAAHHFYAAMSDMEDPEVRRESQRTIAEILEMGTRLYVGTDELVDYYEEKTGFRLGYLGDPSVTFDDGEVRQMMAGSKRDVRTVKGPLKVFFPPNMNVEKGYRTAVAASRAIVESEQLSQEFTPTLRFVPRPNTIKEVVEEAESLKANPKARFIEGVLTDEDFQAVTLGADIIAIPYTNRAFNRRMSGSLTDALMTAKPIVATRGTYVGNQVERFGCGEVFDEGDVPGLLEALRKVRGDFARYKSAAIKARSRYFEERSWGSLYRRVIENKR